MSNIVEFPNPNAPDADCVQVINGVKWYLYTIDYKYEPSILGYFSFRIWATGIEDAERRLEAIKSTAGNLTRVLGIIPDNRG